MRERHRLGMALFVLSEAFFFVLLIGAYIYFRAGFNETPGTAVLRPASTTIGNPASVLDVMRTGIFSILLVLSSATIWLAERATRRQDRRPARMWLGATIVLGTLFLYGQATEYLGLIRH